MSKRWISLLSSYYINNKLNLLGLEMRALKIHLVYLYLLRRDQEELECIISISKLGI